MKHDNIDQVAQFWNQIAADFDDIYTGRKSAVGRALDRWLRKDMFQRFDWVMATAGDVRGKTACDVGCGSGRFVPALVKRGAASVVGVDISPNMIALSRKLAALEQVTDRCEFFESDVLDWNTEKKFDLVIAIGFWDYIADPLPRLRLIRKMTRGKFLSAWPRLWTWRMPVRKVRLTLKRCPVYFFPKSRVSGLLEQAGFQVISFNTVGKLFCVEARPVGGDGPPVIGHSAEHRTWSESPACEITAQLHNE
jgi:SAM-dependent methyltransferase